MPTFSPKQTKWNKSLSGTILLPIGRMSYPNLFVPKAMKGEPDDKAKYSVTVLFPKNVDVKPGQALVLAAAADKWGQGFKGKIRSPILPNEPKVPDPELTEAFPWLIRCSSNYKPEVIFASGEPCQTPEEVYAGRWAWVSVQPFAWDHPLSGKGVSFGLSNVVLFDHDDRIGGGRTKAADDFPDLFPQASSVLG